MGSEIRRRSNARGVKVANRKKKARGKPQVKTREKRQKEYGVSPRETRKGEDPGIPPQVAGSAENFPGGGRCPEWGEQEGIGAAQPST